jgi:hypothetical protein
MKYLKSDMIRALITEAEGLSDLDYSQILDKNGPVFIGGFYFWPSSVLRDAPDYDDSGEVRARGQMFDESKKQYIDSIVNKLKADLKAEIDKAFDEEVIF